MKIEHPLDILKSRQLYERFEDMSPDGKLSILIEDDGDVIVTIFEPDSMTHEAFMASAQFCTYSGGGQSPKVRDALLQLALAIKEENENSPQHREPYGKIE